MLVGGVLLPHPPIILPAYAGERGPEVDRTIESVRRACRWLAELQPQRLVVAAPHRGHGFEVPLHFLREALGELPPTRRILTVEPHPSYLELGSCLRQEEAEAPTRTAVVASGDCSHRLRPEGPYGYHPAGPALDRAIRAGVRSGRPEELLAIDPETVEAGGECGLRSFIFALAALRPRRCRLLSYQAPYGVGYLVALLEV